MLTLTQNVVNIDVYGYIKTLDVFSLPQKTVILPPVSEPLP